MSQLAFRILVASSAELLAKEKTDLWDSGRVESDRSLLVAYAGKPLSSWQQCFWKIKLTTSDNTELESDVATWTMGILRGEDWRARWIAVPEEDQVSGMDIKGATWIWGFPAGKGPGNASPGLCRLSRKFDLPNDAVIFEAPLLVTADNFATVNFNGKMVAAITQWKAGRIIDLKDLLVPGANELNILAENGGSGLNPAGVICKLRIRLAGGRTTEIVSDKFWSVEAGSGAAQSRQTTEIAPWGEGPWGTQAKFNAPGDPLPVFRKIFTVRSGQERSGKGAGQYSRAGTL